MEFLPYWISLMNKVSKIIQFPEDGLIAAFTGKNYEEAIKLAHEWAQRNNKELTFYYEQIAFGKSILVSYRKEDKDE